MDISGWTAGLFIPNNRSIGGIVAQVTIQEQERDELQITEHPVEQGAPISDHAFKRPSEVSIRAGWSKDGAGNLSASGNGMYGILLSWQAALNPFNLYTGKRQYKNMLIQSLTVTTDEASEYALMADIVCREVIIVSTSTAQVSQSNVSGGTGSQADPAGNGPATNNGTVQGYTVGDATKSQVVTYKDANMSTDLQVSKDLTDPAIPLPGSLPEVPSGGL